VPNFIEIELFSHFDGSVVSALSILSDPICFSFFGTIIFTVLGTLALRKQIYRILDEGSKSVSVEWNLISFGMFISMVPYGLEFESFAVIVQCAFRIPLYLILLAILHKQRLSFSFSQQLIALIMFLAVVGSYEYRAEVASVLLWINVFAVAHQARKIVKTEDVEGVELDLLIVYFLSAVFWVGYGFATEKLSIKLWGSGYILAYLSVIIVYKIHAPKSDTEHAPSID
jgi:uncharacterized protein with PQ loop repeat